MTKYNVYIFTGIPDYGTSGSVEVQKMSLTECFNKVFNKYYERNMKDFFDKGFSYDIKEMTVKDIWNAAGGICCPATAMTQTAAVRPTKYARTWNTVTARQEI